VPFLCLHIYIKLNFIIIRAGAIGQQVMKVAKALGMNILIYSRTPKDLGDSTIKLVSL